MLHQWQLTANLKQVKECGTEYGYLISLYPFLLIMMYVYHFITCLHAVAYS